MLERHYMCQVHTENSGLCPELCHAGPMKFSTAQTLQVALVRCGPLIAPPFGLGVWRECETGDERNRRTRSRESVPRLVKSSRRPRSQVKERNLHGGGNPVHPLIEAGKLYLLAHVSQKLDRS